MVVVVVSVGVVVVDVVEERAEEEGAPLADGPSDASPERDCPPVRERRHEADGGTPVDGVDEDPGEPVEVPLGIGGRQYLDVDGRHCLAPGDVSVRSIAAKSVTPGSRPSCFSSVVT